MPQDDIIFDEKWYLASHPDVAAAIRKGRFTSALDHYLTYGRSEGRKPHDARLGELLRRAGEKLVGSNIHVDSFEVSTPGWGLLAGWLDDRADALADLSLIPAIGGALDLRPRLARFRRPDISAMKAVSEGDHDFGFWVVLDGMARRLLPLGCKLHAGFASGRGVTLDLQPRVVAAIDIRDRILDRLSHEPRIERRVAQLTGAVGSIVHDITRERLRNAAAPEPVRYCRPDLTPRLTIVVCLYRRIEYALEQAALFGRAPGIGEVELIYVNNSPERSEHLHAFMRNAQLLYGIQASVLDMPFNTGFAHANNAGVAAARSDTVLLLNPDIVPVDDGWLEASLAAADAMAPTDLIGAKLLYDDGSIQHFGLFFRQANRKLDLWHNDHLLKGLHRDHPAAQGRVEVPAVTAAFLLVRRRFFRELGGFDENYLFGEYEDSDLCLRAREAGASVFVDATILLHHLEGKGSERQPRERAASFINGWYHSRRWSRTMAALAGRDWLPSVGAGRDGSLSSATLLDRAR